MTALKLKKSDEVSNNLKGSGWDTISVAWSGKCHANVSNSKHIAINDSWGLQLDSAFRILSLSKSLVPYSAHKAYLLDWRCVILCLCSNHSFASFQVTTSQVWYVASELLSHAHDCREPQTRTINLKCDDSRQQRTAVVTQNEHCVQIL